MVNVHQNSTLTYGTLRMHEPVPHPGRSCGCGLESNQLLEPVWTLLDTAGTTRRQVRQIGDRNPVTT
jgi:hypothetical protein